MVPRSGLRLPFFLLFATLLASAPLGAQAETPPDSTDILRTILLPRAAEILREQGVPEEEVRDVVVGAREQGVPPAEATEVLEETSRAVEENGPVENFGAFVQARLAEGLRGRDLAAAIRAEHAARGIGRGARLDSRRGPPEGRGRDGARGRPQGTGQGADSASGPGGRRGPEAARGGRGRPDTAGAAAVGRGAADGRARGGRPDTLRPDTTRGGGAARRSGGNGGEA